jgi:16S rRNA pseudouridine516 synthase
VRISGEVMRDPARKVAANTPLVFDDRVLTPDVGHRYLMLHKPAGYVCGRHAEGSHLSALSLIDLPHADRLSFAGRLDADTTGLVLLSDDGQWVHRIISPRSGCEKTYRVELAEALERGAIEQLEAGVMLRGESNPTLPARLVQLAPEGCHITLTEGRYHQVKRMFAAVGNHVVALHRDRIGALELDPALQPGDWRPLTTSEVASI